jgi:hypothetical protein
MITEKEFQNAVVELAKWTGWMVYHPLPAQNSRGHWRTPTLGDVGFPDLVLAHSTKGVIFAELKSRIGKVSDAQMNWITTIRAAGHEAYVWRPADLPYIKDILTGGTR